MDANKFEEVATSSGTSEFSLVDANWSTAGSNCLNTENSTLLYIAVAPVQFNDFDSHVSPLDPNMSSVARYSPVYNDSTTEFNPVIIHQLISQSDEVNNENPQFKLDTNLNPSSNQLLQMVESTSNSLTSESFQLISNPNDQEVELFITDQATGISYSVTQELLVGRLGEEQLLEALAPDQLLDSELLTLDEPLKSEINGTDVVIDSNVTQAITQQVTNFINNMGESDFDKGLQALKADDIGQNTKSGESNGGQEIVYSIKNKSTPSHARSSLPDDFLTIEEIEPGNFGIFAKSTIPMGMQMGPLEGILKRYDIQQSDSSNDDNSLKFLLSFNNELYRLNVDNEESSNWMSFIRKANTYKEQNLVISQQNDSLYFTTIKIIEPKQELKVGYSKFYANIHNLRALEPTSHPCSECSTSFTSLDDLTAHVSKEHESIAISECEDDNNDLQETEEDVDDPKTNDKQKQVKNNNNNSKKSNFQTFDTMQCKLCQQVFLPSCNNDFKLREHLEMIHNISRENTNEDFFILTKCFTCFYCNISFGSEAVMQIHVLEHVDSDVDDQISNKICPNCQRKFPTSRQLVMHVLQHKLSLPQKQLTENKPLKCQICYKTFNLRERLQRHMLNHGSDDTKPWECKTCGKRFLNNSALICHVKSHSTDKKLFECPICKERFDNVLQLKLHVPQHIKNNCFTCPVCKKVFKKYAIIRKHIRSFHCGKKHHCQYCPKWFPTIDKLRMHLLRHSDHKEFLCSDCGKQFKRKDKLKEHCKRMHSEERENKKPTKKLPVANNTKKIINRSEPSDFDRFIYKCATCVLGFKRRGMLVNHLAKRHPDIPPDSVPELNLPILQTTRDYYCQYCEKVYKSSSKRKAHILKNHPGAALPMSNRKQSALPEGVPNPTFSQPVGSITTRPQSCNWCHKQYASKAKLLQHQRKKHPEQMSQQQAQQKSEENVAPIVAKENNDSAKPAAISTEDICLNKKSDFHIISINANGQFTQQTTFDASQDSQLYKLLTTATSNELLQPS